MTPRASRIIVLLALLSAGGGRAVAQAAPSWATLMGQGIVVLDRVDPIPGGGSLSEVRAVQPVVMLEAGTLANHLRFTGTINLEGLTIPQGELLPGG
jgi:hypothetical protein